MDKAEPFDPSWTNAQDLCGLKGSTVQGGIGPFGLLALASEKLEEYTPVVFRLFTGLYKHVVLLCSDAGRFVLPLKINISFFLCQTFRFILINFVYCGSSSLRKEGLYKPSFAGFVDVDLDDTYKISLRTLVHTCPSNNFCFF